MMERRKDRYKKLDDSLKKEEAQNKKKAIIKFIVKILVVVFLIILSLIMYMHYVGTKGLNIREYKVGSKQLPESMHGLKIVQFSDLNYLSTVKQKELENVIRKINKVKPDIVVFTGNLINSGVKLSNSDKKVLIDSLNMIEAKIGLYAILGSRDYNKQYKSIMSQTNFKIITNSYELVYYKGSTPIMLVGCGSSIKKDCDLGQAFSFNEIDNIYTVALIHEPDIAEKIVKSYNANLILAGHSLNGQIKLPGIGGLIKKDGAKKYYNEKYVINGTPLYISGGIGTSGYKLRYFNHPNITLYRLTKETNKK